MHSVNQQTVPNKGSGPSARFHHRIRRTFVSRLQLSVLTASLLGQTDRSMAGSSVLRHRVIGRPAQLKRRSMRSNPGPLRVSVCRLPGSVREPPEPHRSQAERSRMPAPTTTDGSRCDLTTKVLSPSERLPLASADQERSLYPAIPAQPAVQANPGHPQNCTRVD